MRKPPFNVKRRETGALSQLTATITDVWKNGRPGSFSPGVLRGHLLSCAWIHRVVAPLRGVDVRRGDCGIPLAGDVWKVWLVSAECFFATVERCVEVVACRERAVSFVLATPVTCQTKVRSVVAENYS